jgi:ATP-dependent DNA helicase RecQ
MHGGPDIETPPDLTPPELTPPALKTDAPTEFGVRAHELLRQLTGHPDATLRPSQLEAIEALAGHRQRVLLVQRTGWGKSAVYFITTKLLRDQGAGPTLLVSPLLALMRNQIDAAGRMGLRAATLNSSNTAEWPAVRAAIAADEIDVLLVSPERFANAGFREEVLPIVSPRSGLLVVDEAHCISDWGHDFRPDYRRIVGILDLLPKGVPVLCCTATANDRVVADIEHQLGDDLVVLRGPLARAGLSLHVLELPSQAQRLAWLAEQVPHLPGTGIIYCLTVRDTGIVADWLQTNGVDAIAYSGGDTDEHRAEVERRLLANEVKVVVATSALGMGFDKPDLAFVIHYQAPGSSIAYYQQVGRAGRGLDESLGVLLRGAEDVDIQDWFINMAFPPPDITDRVLGALSEKPGYIGLAELEKRVNLGRSRLQVLLKVLEVEGAVDANGQKYRRTAEPWHYDEHRIAGVTAQRKVEQQQMRDYAATDGCRMAFLQRLLDDPDPATCGRCDTCRGVSLPGVSPALVEAARRHLCAAPLSIEARKQWPFKVDDSTKIPLDQRVEDGRALCRWGDGGWSDLMRRGQREGRFDDELVDAAVAFIRAWGPTPSPTWITWVPSIRSPTLVADLAHRLGERLGLPAIETVTKFRETKPQRQMANSAQQVNNVGGAFETGPDGRPEPVLLVDDTVASRWTITTVGSLLRQAGCPAVHPFVLADTGGT